MRDQSRVEGAARPVPLTLCAATVSASHVGVQHRPQFVGVFGEPLLVVTGQQPHRTHPRSSGGRPVALIEQEYYLMAPSP
jgi:hypothetical protein